MTLIPKSEVRNVTGISDAQRQRITDFLQGAVYCWCKNRKDEWFSLRDLMGGENYYWSGTPIHLLYDKHKGRQDDPVKEAGKDAGWMLKAVISEDKRLFKTEKKKLTRHYRWIDSKEDT